MVVGGTSASSPIIAAMYALAGTPAAGTNPASYPYATPQPVRRHLRQQRLLLPGLPVHRRTGYDGPTGLGTPNGTAAFTAGSTSGNTVTVTNPGSQSATVGTAVSLQITATDSATGQTLTYSATGLPTGLSISSSTGLISGTPTTAGTSTVTVTAKDTTNASGSAPSPGRSAPPAAAARPRPAARQPRLRDRLRRPWTATTGVIDDDARAAHTGTWKAWLDGYGTTHTDTAVPVRDHPGRLHRHPFTFWLHIDTAETDHHALRQADRHRNGTTMATYSNLNDNTGYAQKTISLSSYAGQTVTLKFTGTDLTGPAGQVEHARSGGQPQRTKRGQLFAGERIMDATAALPDHESPRQVIHARQPFDIVMISSHLITSVLNAPYVLGHREARGKHQGPGLAAGTPPPAGEPRVARPLAFAS